jgi:hypothetical protein
VPACGLDGQLQGIEIRTADVGSGSASDYQTHELTARQLTPKAGGQIAAFHGGQRSAIC